MTQETTLNPAVHDLTTETDKPYIIRTVTVRGIFNQYVPMATIEECREMIALSEKLDAERHAESERKKQTAEYQEYAREVLAATGFDPMKVEEPVREYVICRIGYEVVV